MKLPKIIAFTGLICSGKDFAAQQFINKLKYRKIGFADPLKEEVAKRFGVTVGDIELEKDLYRSALQELGEGKRQDDENYWVRIHHDTFFSLPENQPVVVTDLRYPNELRYLQALDALIVSVRVDEAVRRKRILRRYPLTTEEELNHTSERQIIPAHFKLDGELDRELIVPFILSASESFDIKRIEID